MQVVDIHSRYPLWIWWLEASFLFLMTLPFSSNKGGDGRLALPCRDDSQWVETVFSGVYLLCIIKTLGVIIVGNEN